MKLNELIKGKVYHFPLQPREKGVRVVTSRDEIPTGVTKIDAETFFSNDGYGLVKKALGSGGFIEKPDSFEEIDHCERKPPLTDLELQKIKNAFKSAHVDLPEHEAERVMSSTRGPLADAKLPGAETFILKFKSGKHYLCNTTGASSYVRMWRAIK